MKSNFKKTEQIQREQQTSIQQQQQTPQPTIAQLENNNNNSSRLLEQATSQIDSLQRQLSLSKTALQSQLEHERQTHEHEKQMLIERHKSSMESFQLQESLLRKKLEFQISELRDLNDLEKSKSLDQKHSLEKQLADLRRTLDQLKYELLTTRDENEQHLQRANQELMKQRKYTAQLQNEIDDDKQQIQQHKRNVENLGFLLHEEQNKATSVIQKQKSEMNEQIQSFEQSWLLLLQEKQTLEKELELGQQRSVQQSRLLALRQDDTEVVDLLRHYANEQKQYILKREETISRLEKHSQSLLEQIQLVERQYETLKSYYSQTSVGQLQSQMQMFQNKQFELEKTNKQLRDDQITQSKENEKDKATIYKLLLKERKKLASYESFATQRQQLENEKQAIMKQANTQIKQIEQQLESERIKHQLLEKKTNTLTSEQILSSELISELRMSLKQKDQSLKFMREEKQVYKFLCLFLLIHFLSFDCLGFIGSTHYKRHKRTRTRKSILKKSVRTNSC